MTKEQANQILKNVIDGLRLTRQEYEQLILALKIVSEDSKQQTIEKK